jgi:DNA-binding transcriptional ArsR family regulator
MSMFECVMFCKAMADSTRQEILGLLREGEMCVTEIAQALPVSQPTISDHLSILRHAGLVHVRRDGKQMYYSVHRDRMMHCCEMIMAHFCHCRSQHSR